jgi:protein involved in polysaccharide export with SLBB domain
VSFVRGATALGAIQAAGGFLPATADLDEVCVVRDRMGTRAAYAVDLAGVLAGEARDLWLQPGDVVHVAPRLLTRWDRWWRQAVPWAEPVDAARR